MMHLDTHVVVWLFAGDLARIPVNAQRRLEQETLAISPLVNLELQYLFESDRIGQPAHAIVEDLRARIGLAMAKVGLAEVVSAAVTLDWTRDPFDRLIAGHAVAEGATLLTADQSIRKHLNLAVWDE